MSELDLATAEGVRQLRFVAPAGATTILLIRHGESVPAQEGQPFALVDGQGDPELDRRGQAQAERVAARLTAPGSVWTGPDGSLIEAIYVSNLRRTAETAAPLVARLGIEPQTDPDLREVHLGEWEGGLYRIRILEGHPLAARMMSEGRWDVIPGAERDEDFAARVKAALDRVATRHAGQTVAVFTHGGFIGRALAEATQSQPFAFLGADNGSMSQIVITEGRWVVRSYNDTAHLEVPATPG